MDTHKGEVKIFNHWFTWQEIFTYCFLVAAVVLAIAGIIGNNIALYLSSILFFLSTFALYVFFFMRQTDKKLDVLYKSLGATSKLEGQLINLKHDIEAIGKLEIIEEPDDVFHFGLKAVEAGKILGGWDCVRIYAPVGLWDPSPTKDKWLEALQLELGTNPVNNGSVRGFRAVYGLPTSKEAFHEYAERRLLLFKNTNNTKIHYLPPEDKDHPTPAPGVGAILFENRRNQRYVGIFAYIGKSTDDNVQRSGYVLKDSDAGRLLVDWFDDQVFEGCSRMLVLRGQDPDDRNKWIDIEKKISEIKDKYY